MSVLEPAPDQSGEPGDRACASTSPRGAWRRGV